MTLWQYNAWCEAYRARMRDGLSLQIQAAYLGAYWSSSAKRKKSLQSVLKGLEGKPQVRKKETNFVQVANKFKQFEELQQYGRTQIDSN